LRISALLALCAVFANPAISQSGKGTIVGRAADAENALLPGARVRVEPGNVSVITDQVGEFTVIDLAPGDYKVTITYVGFLPYTSNVKVVAGQATRVDAVLKVAARGEEVTVALEEEVKVAHRARGKSNRAWAQFG
jgi:cell wall assembly regulator SMI1